MAGQHWERIWLMDEQAEYPLRRLKQVAANFVQKPLPAPKLRGGHRGRELLDFPGVREKIISLVESGMNLKTIHNFFQESNLVLTKKQLADLLLEVLGEEKYSERFGSKGVAKGKKERKASSERDEGSFFIGGGDESSKSDGIGGKVETSDSVSTDEQVKKPSDSVSTDERVKKPVDRLDKFFFDKD